MTFSYMETIKTKKELPKDLKVLTEQKNNVFMGYLGEKNCIVLFVPVTTTQCCSTFTCNCKIELSDNVTNDIELSDNCQIMLQ